MQTGQEYGDKESNVHQLVPIASSVCEIGHILEEQQMQINALNLQVETLTTQMSELRENQQVLNEIKEFVECFYRVVRGGKMSVLNEAKSQMEFSLCPSSKKGAKLLSITCPAELYVIK